GTPQPLPTVTYTPQPQSSQIVLIDLPGSVQATVTGKQLIPITEPAPTEALNLGNKVLAGGFTSRVNMNLREDKHWTYGFIGYPIVREYSSYFAMEGTIQQDKVGPAIAEVMKEVSGVMSDRPITALEFDRVKTAAIGEVAVSYTNRYSILGELGRIREFGRPDSYPGQLSQRYRAVTREAASDALRTQLNGNRWIWGVVGNAAIIRPQLEKLGLPITVVKPEEIMPPM
ncbi:MAG TPA: insulinase family protein, partial [Sphingomonas sp.]|nr:insulinase family protein [Sphingomonas sp.]